MSWWCGGQGASVPTVLKQMFTGHGVEGSRRMLLLAKQVGLRLPAVAAPRSAPASDEARSSRPVFPLGSPFQRQR